MSDRVAAEQEIIQGIAEHLCRERPGTTVAENWREAVDLHRNVYATEIRPPMETQS
jgi:hypothetical protein